jgi:hypothetical protein
MSDTMIQINELRRKVRSAVRDITTSDLCAALLELDDRLRKVEELANTASVRLTPEAAKAIRDAMEPTEMVAADAGFGTNVPVPAGLLLPKRTVPFEPQTADLDDGTRAVNINVVPVYDDLNKCVIASRVEFFGRDGEARNCTFTGPGHHERATDYCRWLTEKLAKQENKWPKGDEPRQFAH